MRYTHVEVSEFRKIAHGVGQNCFHLILAPKYRHPVFRSEWIRLPCETALREVAARHKIEIEELCVEPDHVHIFVELHPTMSVSTSVRLLKGGAAYILRKRNRWMRRYKSLWSPAKFYRSVGSVTDTAITRYLVDAHHSSKIPREQTRLK